MPLNLSVPEVNELKPRIAVFGVGGAGGNAVNNMIESSLEGVEFIVANTDAQALGLSKASHRIQLGAETTQGLGAGSLPEIGGAAAQESIEEIKDYVPEVTEEPGFATQVARTWSASIDAVGGFFTRLSLATVGFIPWLTVVLPLALVGWLVFKRVRRSVKLPIALSSPNKPEQPKATS